MKGGINKKMTVILKRLEIWLFCFFLVTMTLSVRKIIYERQIRSVFNEYSGIYIYLSDIALILVFFLYILNNKNLILSNIKQQYFKLFHVEQFIKFKKEFINYIDNCSTWNNCIHRNMVVPRGTKCFHKICAQVIHNYWIFFPLVAVFFSFISILWTTEWKIGLFRSVKLLEFVLLYFYIMQIVPRGTNEKESLEKNKLFHVEQFRKFRNTFCFMLNKIKVFLNNVPRGTLFKKYDYTDLNLKNKLFHVEQMRKKALKKTNCSTWNIIEIIVLIGVVQSLIGIIQFIKQGSIGIFWLKESIISPNLSGVAKVIFDNEVFIRAYGLLPHPNILGGYLVFSIFATLFIGKMFHVEQDDNSTGRAQLLKRKCSTWNNYLIAVANVPRGTKIFFIVLLIQLVALFLTFSKSAIIGLSVGIFYLYYLENKKNVPRGTKYIIGFFKLFHVEQFKKTFLILLIITFGLILVKPDLNTLFIKSLAERNFYLNVSRGTISDDPLLGVGAGQFIFELENVVNIADWQFQPVHNVFLLIASEYGFVILTAFVFFIYCFLKKCSTWNKNVALDNKNEYILIYIKSYLFATLIAYVFIMFFDHYFWDIQQGSMMFWILLGLLAGSEKIKK